MDVEECLCAMVSNEVTRREIDKAHVKQKLGAQLPSFFMFTLSNVLQDFQDKSGCPPNSPHLLPN